MSKESFKVFVKNNPILSTYVKNNEMTWQKFYEMYDLYGEKSDVWQNYLNKTDTRNDNQNLLGNIKGILDLFKGVDLQTIQKTLTGLDRAIGTFREFSGGNSERMQTYETRPTDRYYED